MDGHQKLFWLIVFAELRTRTVFTNTNTKTEAIQPVHTGKSIDMRKEHKKAFLFLNIERPVIKKYNMF